jgi:hypothetical protein
MSTENPPQCSVGTLIRFKDKALSPDNMQNMSAHVAECRKCREWLQEEQILGDALEKITLRASLKVDFIQMEKDILKRFPNGAKRTVDGKFHHWSRRFILNRYMVPTAVAATLVMALVYVQGLQGQWWFGDPEPSAFVQSFSGEVREVMIMQTPALKQTVIWIEEPGDEDLPGVDAAGPDAEIG